ncbi:MAG: response regulator, partial [Leptothrix sp. (in: b-proteobacteria)]
MATVLVVDDHATNRELLVALLTYSGHHAIEAADGEEALAVVRAERPDLVICDILMPTMDGYEFVRRLRADAEIAATEVIFHSATFLEHEASKLASACGVSRVLVKPCEPEVFLDVVAQALAQRAPVDTAVDDSNFDRAHLRLMTDKLLVKADELELANRRLSALTDLNLQLASEHHPHTLLDKICRGARELIGARSAMLCVRNGRDAAELYRSTWGLDPADAARLPPPELAAGLFGQVLAGRTARRFVSPTGDPVAAGLPAGFPALQSGLVVPIVSLQHCYGWVLLLDRLGAPEFSADDEHLLAILAAQSGRIYENGSLYARVQRQLVELQAEMAERLRAEARIERLHHVATLLSEVNSLIVRVRDRSELFDEACRIAVEVGRFGQAWIGLVQA